MQPEHDESTPSHKLLAEASLHKAGTMGRAIGHARAHRHSTMQGARRTAHAIEAGSPTRLGEDSRDLSDAFVGAGALKMELEVGTEAGSRSCVLQGMLLLPGVYEAALQVVGLRESMTGSRLPVNDYVISHPLRISVVGDSAGLDAAKLDNGGQRCSEWLGADASSL